MTGVQTCALPICFPVTIGFRLEYMRRTGEMAKIDEYVSNEMKKIKVEIKQNGQWTVVDKNLKLDE